DDRREIEQTDIEILDDAAGFENTVERTFQTFRQTRVLATQFCKRFVRHDDPAHHHDARRYRGKIVVEAGEFFAAFHGFHEKWLELLAGALRFGQREQSLFWFRRVVLWKFVVLIGHAIPPSCGWGLVLRLAQRKHAVERGAREVAGTAIHGDLVEVFAGAMIFQRTQKMYWINSKNENEHEDSRNNGS